MNSLLDHQENFVNQIINPLISEQPNRFTVYHNNWRLGLLKALIHIYPVCERLTGKQFFKGMALEYIKKHYSTSFSLNHYGHDFFEFVKNFVPASSLLYLSDVANLEWAVHEVQIGTPYKKLETFKIHEIINNNENNIDLKLSIIENCRLITSEFPIQKIWQSNQDDYAGETNINLDEGSTWLLIWRKELELQIDILEKSEWELLRTIKNKFYLSKIIESGFDNHAHLSFLEKTLSNFVKKGYLIVSKCME